MSSLFTQKIIAFIIAYFLLHIILFISVFFGYKLTGYLVDTDILLFIILCAYFNLWYNIFIKQ